MHSNDPLMINDVRQAILVFPRITLIKAQPWTSLDVVPPLHPPLYPSGDVTAKE